MDSIKKGVTSIGRESFKNYFKIKLGQFWSYKNVYFSKQNRSKKRTWPNFY